MARKKDEDLLLAAKKGFAVLTFAALAALVFGSLVQASEPKQGK